jgi:hypothetical protein
MPDERCSIDRFSSDFLYSKIVNEFLYSNPFCFPTSIRMTSPVPSEPLPASARALGIVELVWKMFRYMAPVDQRAFVL